MKRKMATALCLLLFVFTIVSVAACGNSKLTMENYDKITCGSIISSGEGGMTIDEVKDILGKPDNESSSSTMGVTVAVYVWGNEKKCITVSFVEGKAISKVQIGL